MTSMLRPYFHLAGVLAVLLASGCRAPLRQAAERTRELRDMEEDRVLARCTEDRLVCRFRIRGRDAFAVAELPRRSADAQTVLSFGKEARTVFGAAGSRVTVLGAGAYESLTRAVCRRLAPDAPRGGALVTLAGREAVLCRPADAEPGIYPLNQLPQGVKITRRLAPAAFISAMCAELKTMQSPAPALLLTGGDPALVYIEPQAQRLTFISAPEEEVMKIPLLGASPDVTVRGLLSIGVRSGVLHTLKNPATTAVHGVANALSMADAAGYSLLASLPQTAPPPVAVRPPMDPAAWEKRLDRITGTRAEPAALRLRIGGDAFFPDFIQAVQEAQQSIDILFYIWDTDDYAIQMADLLRERSHHVRVRVLLDEAACYQAALSAPSSPQRPDHRAPSSIVDYLRRGSRIDVRPMAMTALSANHSKMVIIDGQRAWLGGMNIGREYRVDWHDMMVEVHGPLTGWMQRQFATTWAHHGWGGDFSAFLRMLRHAGKKPAPVPAPPGAFPVRPLLSSAVHRDIRQSQIEALRRARQRVWLENAYITDVRYIRELILARHRGVDVRVILPEENDSPLLKASNRALTALFRRHGIRVWLLPGMSHVKAALYDGWATTGSSNYDRLSLRVNTEFNIAWSHPPAVAELERALFLRDMARGRELTEVPSASPARRLGDALLRLMAGQL